MRINVLLHVILIAFTFFSCTNSKRKSEVKVNLKSDYAHGFSIEMIDSALQLTTFSPWEKSNGQSFNYYLANDLSKLPKNLIAEGIQIPVKRVICLSTTHIAYLDALGETNAIVGVSGAKYVSNSKIISKIESGLVPDVGYDQNLNYELIIKLKPDVVFAYGVGSEVVGLLNRLTQFGIKVVLVGDYLEQNPLGKTEWIKFFGSFFNKERQADSIFNAIGIRYNNLKNSVKTTKNRPLVMTGLPFKDNWWIPGGQSYFATLLKDAGASYCWNENTSNESFVVSFEDMILKSSKADYWLNTGSASSKAEILAADERFASFNPYIKNSIFNNNLRTNKLGGNDFWESGVMHPDVVLNDLISIFHPTFAFNVDKVYYQKLD